MRRAVLLLTAMVAVVLLASGVGLAQSTSTGPTFMTEWGGYGREDGQFRQPLGVASDASGNIYVVDQKSPRLQKFDSEGNFVTTWGDYGRGNGEFHLGLKGSQQYYVSLYAWVARVRFHRRRIPLL